MAARGGRRSGRGARARPEWVSDGGERVTHLYPNDCYFAHLSIYEFAAGLCAGRDVLDAGSGAGYGAAHLASRGARSVLAVDSSRKAVRFSRRWFDAENLTFLQRRIEDLSSLEPRVFDVIVSSNALEHVYGVETFLGAATRLLAPGGLLVLAVPPITCEADRAANLANPYHLNIWTPRQWVAAAAAYFGEVATYRHVFAGGGAPLDFRNTPAQTTIDEGAFRFEPVAVDAFYGSPSITLVLTARKPRPEVPPTAPELVEGSLTRRPPSRVAELQRLARQGVAAARTEGVAAALRKAVHRVVRLLRGV